jgi:alkylation response protein AidB-like acyl-CoA dehydrogenase
MIPAAEQEELRATLRRLFTSHSPEAAIRTVMATETGIDEELWRRLGSSELGVLGLHLPEEFGGSGYGFAEFGIVLEEAGAALACVPLLSSAVLATSAILHSGDRAARKELLPPLAAGELRGTVALTESGGGWDEAAVRATAARTDDGWELSGQKNFVLDGHTADLLVVAARTPVGISLFCVGPDAPGLTRTAETALDQTRPLASLDLRNTPARLLGEEGAGWPVIEKVLQLGCVALAAEQVGAARRVLDVAVDYAKTRVQFGRAIGSFQVIKHKCADMLIAVESAGAAAEYALRTAGSDDLPIASALAKAYCSEAFSQVAADNIQIHGGTGFTWEHSAHLYFKRAKATSLLFGDAVHQRELLARLLAA